MIDPRKVSTLGIGFGAIAIATIGLLPYTLPPTGDTCGNICSSVIIGKFQLGCTPITGKFDLTYSYTLPPVIPPSGGGGGYAGANWGNLRHLTPKLTECIQEVDIAVKFVDGISFEQHYNVDVCNTKKRVKATVVTTTNLVPSNAVVNASFVKPSTPIVTASLVDTDK